MRLSGSNACCSAKRKVHSKMRSSSTSPPACQPHARQLQSSRTPLIYVIMGVSGCGKSSVGYSLAQQLSCSFYDADSYHPEANISKMRAGIPLTDEDRWPWLNKLRDILAQHVAENQPAVLSCSALKAAYRQLLRSAAGTAPQQAQHLPQLQQQPQQPEQQQPQQQQHQHQRQQHKQTATLQQPHPSQAPDPGTAAGIEPQSHSGSHLGSTQPDCIAFVLLNPSRAVLQARLEARAAAGDHFMPASLLASQLQQLDVQDASELYMCFGCLQGTQGTQFQPETTASCAHLGAAPLASADCGTCTDEVKTAADSSRSTAAVSLNYNTESGFPSTEQIVAAIVARTGDLCD